MLVFDTKRRHHIAAVTSNVRSGNSPKACIAVVSIDLQPSAREQMRSERQTNWVFGDTVD
jgi:hypothetical protein